MSLKGRAIVVVDFVVVSVGVEVDVMAAVVEDADVDYAEKNMKNLGTLEYEGFVIGD